jgi:hypothetical protein
MSHLLWDKNVKVYFLFIKCEEKTIMGKTKNNFGRRIRYLLLVVIMLLAMIPLAKPFPAEASSWSDLVSFTKGTSYTDKDELYTMPFTIKAVDSYYPIVCWASLYYPSGKKVYNDWVTKYIAPGTSLSRNFSMDFRSLPSGTYTFKLYVQNDYNSQASWSWSYNITHKNTSSFSYKSYETYYDSDGDYINKINIQCTNMKGERLYCKIYDEYGYLVYDWGKNTTVRKTNNEVGWFGWSGYINGVKYPSGNYTFIITSSNSNKVVEKTLYLKILEKSRG